MAGTHTEKVSGADDSERQEGETVGRYRIYYTTSGNAIFLALNKSAALLMIQNNYEPTDADFSEVIARYMKSLVNDLHIKFTGQ